MFDEIEGRQTSRAIAALVVTMVFAGLAAVKVKNELQMTKAYDRQAAALERIAHAVERPVTTFENRVAGVRSTLAPSTLKQIDAFAQAHAVGAEWTEKQDCNTAKCKQLTKNMAACSTTAMFCGGDTR